MPKNMASKGGASQKIWCVKGGGSPKKIPLSSDSVCNNANIRCQKAKNSVSKVLKIQILPGENAPGPPYFIIHPTTTLSQQLFHYKIQPGGCQLFFCLCWPDSLTTEQLITVAKIMLSLAAGIVCLCTSECSKLH